MKEIAEQLYHEISKKDVAKNDIRLCRESIIQLLETIEDGTFKNVKRW